MDSRTKIKTWEELRPELTKGGWKIIAGIFDPLTPEAAARIACVWESGRKLLVVIRSNGDDLFDAVARAQMVAALRAVDTVLIEDCQDWRVVAGGNPEAMVSDDTADCMKRRKEFEEFVLSRATSGA